MIEAGRDTVLQAGVQQLIAGALDVGAVDVGAGDATPLLLHEIGIRQQGARRADTDIEQGRNRGDAS